MISRSSPRLRYCPNLKNRRIPIPRGKVLGPSLVCLELYDLHKVRFLSLRIKVLPTTIKTDQGIENRVQLTPKEFGNSHCRLYIDWEKFGITGETRGWSDWNTIREAVNASEAWTPPSDYAKLHNAGNAAHNHGRYVPAITAPRAF